ncbi:pyrimidine/purine nucleoside phosphorylase [Pedobacter sp.]
MIALNEYFDGAVKSLGYNNNGKSTVGVIAPGEYEFGTSTHEVMYIVEGEMQVWLPGEDVWKTYETGAQFEVEADSSFKVKVTVHVAYHCKYGL